jgi:hypothetical protein
MRFFSRLAVTITMISTVLLVYANLAVAAPRMGYMCDGPTSVHASGGLVVPGSGEITCQRKPCSFVLSHRPWCPKRDPRQIITIVFGKNAKQAIEVAWCESRFYVYAGGHGTYQGPFQVDAMWRSKWAGKWGPSMWHRVRHAKMIWKASGRSWSPWQCRPRS